MKKTEVDLGHTYIAKVSGKPARVKLLEVSPFGGWSATNLDTGRLIRIRTAARLRREVNPKVTPTEGGTKS